MLRIILALALCGVLAGCGQSGPLYLPGDPSEVMSAPPPEQPPEPEEDADESEG
ncbi:MAG: lipoprotein [Woeseiaceae bacterium]|nr:lipoprotein [Woeseiaceae bacterium]